MRCAQRPKGRPFAATFRAEVAVADPLNRDAHLRCLRVALGQIIVTRSEQIRTIAAGIARLSDGFHGYKADNGIR
jgi:hypothetical protein